MYFPYQKDSGSKALHIALVSKSTDLEKQVKNGVSRGQIVLTTFQDLLELEEYLTFPLSGFEIVIVDRNNLVDDIAVVEREINDLFGVSPIFVYSDPSQACALEKQLSRAFKIS
ncbi:MAG: hypothetical protein AB7T49_04705 [Oligoflexales bacterium]